MIEVIARFFSKAPKPEEKRPAAEDILLPETGEISELVTHDGDFHFDEVAATVILSDLYPGAEVKRSRLAGLICPGPGRIVYDVGMRYDPAKFVFDHHQKGAARREDGVTYSALGLIWKHFGVAWLRESLSSRHAAVDADFIARLFSRMDAEFVRLVDSVDNGRLAPDAAGRFQGMTMFDMISDMVPDWRIRTGAEDDRSFARAVVLLRQVMASRLDRMLAALAAERDIERAMTCRTDARILVLSHQMPWRDIVPNLEEEELRFVLYPRENGDWLINAVPVTPGSYRARLDLPEAWAGLEFEALRQVTGFDSAVFCHEKRFFAVFGDEADAMAAVMLALEAE